MVVLASCSGLSGLAAWACSHEWTIPPLVIHRPSFNLTLANTLCSGLTTDGVEAHCDRPTTLAPVGHGVLAMGNVSLGCSSSLSFRAATELLPPGALSGHGTVEVTAQDGALAATLDSTSTMLLDGMNVSVGRLHLRLRGDGLLRVANWLRPELQRQLEKLLPGLLERELMQLLAPGALIPTLVNATGAAPALRHMVAECAYPPPPSSPPGTSADDALPPPNLVAAAAIWAAGVAALLAASMLLARLCVANSQARTASEWSKGQARCRLVDLLAAAGLIAAAVLYGLADSRDTGETTISVTLAGLPPSPPVPLERFELLNVIGDMWSARAYFCALALAWSSGAWPYVRLLLLGVLIPPCGRLLRSIVHEMGVGLEGARWLEPRGARRRGALRLLAALTKWAMPEFFIALLLVALFRFDVQLPKPAEPSEPSEPSEPAAAAAAASAGECGASSSDAAAPPPGSCMRIEVDTVPLPLFFAHLGATALSLALCHVLLSGHATSSAPRASSTPAMTCAEPKPEAALLEHRAGDEAPRRSERRSRCTALAAMTLASSAAAAAYIGTTQPILTLRFRGLVGWLVPEPDQVYSLPNFIVAVGAWHQSVGPAPLALLQAVLLLTWVVAPAVWVGALLAALVLGSADSHRLLQSRLLATARVAYSLTTLDVFVVTTAAVAPHLELIARVILGHDCDAIDAILRRSFTPQLGAYGTSCLSVEAALPGAGWAVLAAIVAATVSGQYLTWRAERAMGLQQAVGVAAESGS